MEYLVLFFSFFKIGLFTVGGGYAMIPLIQQIVLEKNWLTELQTIDFIGISESTPGPFAINMATFVGMQVKGILGALSATIGVVLPSFIIILIIARSYDKFMRNKYFQYAILGVRPIVIGSIVSVILSVSFISFFKDQSYLDYKAIIIFLILFFASRKLKVTPVFIIIISGVLGILFFGVFK